MTRSYCSEAFHALLVQAQLDSFEALWQLDLESVDDPNHERGGWSRVCRLELNNSQGHPEAFYIKLQSNHCSRSWRRPFGEPTFAREYRNIRTYQAHAVPALDAVFYQERIQAGEKQAILITRALDNYRPLSDLVEGWQDAPLGLRRATVKHTAKLVGRLHAARLTHHCLYPKHIYVNTELNEPARLIDLEKTRTQLLRKRECVADLAALLRRWKTLEDEERMRFLTHYLKVNDLNISSEALMREFFLRKKNKEARR